MTPVLPADPITSEGFAGLLLQADEVVPALDDGLLGGRRVGLLAATPHHVRLLPQVVQHAGLTKLFVTRPVDVLPASTLGTVAHRVPAAARVVGRLHRWRAVTEPELRRKVTPLGRDVARVVSSDYLRVVQHPRCRVVAWPVTSVVAEGVRTADGLEHHLDVLIHC